MLKLLAEYNLETEKRMTDNVWFEILNAVAITTTAFWNVIPSSTVEIPWQYGRNNCLLLYRIYRNVGTFLQDYLVPYATRHSDLRFTWLLLKVHERTLLPWHTKVPQTSTKFCYFIKSHIVINAVSIFAEIVVDTHDLKGMNLYSSQNLRRRHIISSYIFIILTYF